MQTEIEKKAEAWVEDQAFYDPTYKKWSTTAYLAGASEMREQMKPVVDEDSKRMQALLGVVRAAISILEIEKDYREDLDHTKLNILNGLKAAIKPIDKAARTALATLQP